MHWLTEAVECQREMWKFSEVGESQESHLRSISDVLLISQR